jgi:hypothetical protein
LPPVRRGIPPHPADVVDQTTARLQALNATLERVAADGRDPMLQSQGERLDRKRVRREVYAEILRLVGPEDRVELRQAPVGTDEGKVIVAGAPEKPRDDDEGGQR